jgi:TRAP-type transport system small permease protein
MVPAGDLLDPMAKDTDMQNDTLPSAATTNLSGFSGLWRTVSNACEGVARGIVGVSIIAIVAITIASVWYRYALNAPVSWSEQVCRILFVWSVFAGAAVLYRNALHIVIDMFVLMLPEALQKTLAMVNEALMLLVGILMVWFGLDISINTLGQTYGALEITPASFYFAAPFCGALIIVFWIEKMLDPSRRVPQGTVHL